MANRTLFSSSKSKFPSATATNEAGGRAYHLSPKQALAQLAATGTFNGTFYGTSTSQLSQLKKLIELIDDNLFLAKLAIFARRRAYMKDMPAALLVELSTRDNELTHKIFDQIVDNGRMLRTVFQMVRSGQFGRKGLSSSLRRAFQRWFNQASTPKLLSASIGKDPSLRDVLRMARPKPENNMRRALYGWLTGCDESKWAPATQEDLPIEIKSLMDYRRATSEKQQARIAKDLAVRWDLLADAALGPAVWASIARQMGPQALRMNLNTLKRHGVFEDTNQGVISKIAQAIGINETPECMVDFVAEKLANVDAIVRSRQFPYQFFAAFKNADKSVPSAIKQALHQAAEVACGQVPVMPGPVVVGVDTSGSMGMAVTGNRGQGATSKMLCVDVAAMFAAAILRRNPGSVVVPFDTIAHNEHTNSEESILNLANSLSEHFGGGTNCSIPLQTANNDYLGREFAGAIIISDYESWVGTGRHGSTAIIEQWQQFVDNQKKLDPKSKPKLICVNIQPSGTAQAPERDDILHVAGFSDAVFNVAASFLANDNNRLINEIESIEL